MNQTLSFFGASVTQQKSGYTTHFLKTNYKTYIYGYGGSHLHTAGICMIDEALKENPHYCFLEWFTPSLKYDDKQLTILVETLITKCLKKNTIPIFLFFCKKDDPSDLWEHKMLQYNYIINILEKYGVSYIEVYKKITEDLLNILRDVVHTTDLGSKLYFDVIYEEFLNIQKREHTFLFPPSSKYENIKQIQVNATAKKNIILTGEAEIISILQDLGPFSNKINIISDGALKESTLINPDCYYVRTGFCVSGRFNNTFEIQLLNTFKDKNLYKKEINWERVKIENNCYPETNEMRIKTIFYIGNIKKHTIDK